MTKRQQHPPSTRRTPGFSLIEYLVVVAILAVLIAILIPTLGYVREQAKTASTVALLGSIGTGLEQYHSQHNMYPPSDPQLPNGNPAYDNFDRGGLMLTESLTGYLPYSFDGAGAGNTSSIADPALGFRTRRPASGAGTGEIYGPYMEAGGKQWKVVSSPPDPNHQVVVDLWGSEILYFRAVPTMIAGQRRDVLTVFGNRADAPFQSLFVIDHNTKAYREALPNLPAGVNSFANAPTNAPFIKLLDANDNTIASGEIVKGRNSYLLVSAGPDREYFTKDDIVYAGK